MKPYQKRSNRPSRSDCVMTPYETAEKVVKHFKPRGKCLEPCRGTGVFTKGLLPNVQWDEIEEGRDFFARTSSLSDGGKFNWIITNPPWSQLTAFLHHSLTLSRNVVFIIHVNQAFMPNRLRIIKLANFGIKEIVLLDTPTRKGWPQGGFQLGAIHFRKGWKGGITMTDLQTYQKLGPGSGAYQTNRPNLFRKDGKPNARGLRVLHRIENKALDKLSTNL